MRRSRSWKRRAERWRLFQLGVFGFGLLDDRGVGVALFDQREEILIMPACFSRIADECVGAAKTQMREGHQRLGRPAIAQCQYLLKLLRGFLAAAHSNQGHAPRIGYLREPGAEAGGRFEDLESLVGPPAADFLPGTRHGHDPLVETRVDRVAFREVRDCRVELAIRPDNGKCLCRGPKETRRVGEGERSGGIRFSLAGQAPVRLTRGSKRLCSGFRARLLETSSQLNDLPLKLSDAAELAVCSSFASLVAQNVHLRIRLTPSPVLLFLPRGGVAFGESDVV